MDRIGHAEPRKYLYNEIVYNFEQMINSGELGAGDRLPSERSLSKRFGVSRICIRQAIQALSEKNILESRRGDGTYVRFRDRPTAVNSLAVAIQAQKEAVRDIIEFRLLMEPQIACLAAKSISKDQIDRLKVIVCDQERKSLAGLDDSALDAAFHMQLVEACGNRVIVEVIDTINDILDESRSEFVQSKARRRISIVGHLKIIDALEARNPEAALKAMREHLMDVERTILGPNETDGPGG